WRGSVHRAHHSRGAGECAVSRLPGAQRSARRVPGAGARARQGCPQRRLDSQRLLPARRLATSAPVTSTSTMRLHILAIPALLALAFNVSAQSPTPSNLAQQYQPAADRLIQAALADSSAWNRLALLTDTFGNRQAGSESLERAIDWTLAEMKQDGLQNVHG